MTSYHFDLGNSNSSPIGCCARVTANSPEEAVEKLRQALPDELPVRIPPDVPGYEAVDYVEIYFNRDAIGVGDIDDESDD